MPPIGCTAAILWTDLFCRHAAGYSEVILTPTAHIPYTSQWLDYNDF